MEVVFVGANNPETIRMISAVKTIVPGFNAVGFLDNDPNKQGKDFFGYPVLGGFDRLPQLVRRGVHFVNLITRDAETRYLTSLEIAKAGGQFANFIHPNVNLEMVTIGAGNYIQNDVVLQAQVRIGNNCSVHMGTLIGHETRIGNSVFIAHGCNVSGGVTVQDGVTMGTGVSVVPRVTVGEWSIVGAGAVIIREVPPRSVVVGNPGRIIRRLETPYQSGDVIQRIS